MLEQALSKENSKPTKQIQSEGKLGAAEEEKKTHEDIKKNTIVWLKQNPVCNTLVL